jgi:hypothetical protein
MRAKRKYVLTLLAGVLCLCASGCEHDEVVRQTALQLRAAVMEDETQIDENIATQREFYKKQLANIETSRARNSELSGDAFRRARTARAATSMSLNPNEEARLSNLMDYLHETHDEEYKLWQELYGGDQKAREELKSRIAKLERQKKLLEDVKKNLGQLALAPHSKKQAQLLLKYSQETYKAFKSTSK